MRTDYGSLFTGVGGLDTGLEAAGWGPSRWQCEFADWRRLVLATKWPCADRYADVSQLPPIIRAARRDGRGPWKEDRHVTLVAGGFPCVDISNAGRRAGIDGDRSGLWAEMARVVRLVRPRVVLVENVAALLVRGIDRVLGDLAACGYDAVWDCVPAAAVGAPHRRDRVFLVAWRVPDAERDGLRLRAERGTGRAQEADCRDAEPEHLGEVLADPDLWRREIERVARRVSEAGLVADGQGGAGEAVADVDGEPGQARRDEPEHQGRPHDVLARVFPPGPDDLQAWGRVPADSQPAVCRLADGAGEILSRCAAKRGALGDSVVPQCAEVAGRVAMRIARALDQ